MSGFHRNKSMNMYFVTTKTWKFLAIETTVSKTIEETPKQKQYRLWNKEVKELSQKQKDLRIQIQNCKQEEKIKELKKERNYVLHNIRRKNSLQIHKLMIRTGRK